MKILFLSHRFHPAVGGIEVNSEILAGEFVRRGHDVTLMTWSKSGPNDDRDFLFPVVRGPSVWQLLQEHWRADVVYENNICLRLSWPQLFRFKPSVIALRTWVNRLDGRIAIQDRVKQARLRHVEGVIAVSDSIRRRCCPTATVIGNPYRKDLFTTRERIQVDRDFVFLGRLVSDKGAGMAIRSLHQLRKRNQATSRLSLTIVGDGPERINLEKLACELGLADFVTFTGTLAGDELVDVLNRHRFLWVPSIWEEPFGNVALEGMACGCIPIVSDGGGLPDAVGEAGLVFKRGDISDMVLQSQRALSDNALCERLTHAAKCHLERHWPENVAGRYLEVLERATCIDGSSD